MTKTKLKGIDKIKLEIISGGVINPDNKIIPEMPKNIIEMIL